MIAWSVTLSVVILRTRSPPAWLDWTGLVVNVLYFINQGDIMSTVIPNFPIWDLADPLELTSRRDRLAPVSGRPRSTAVCCP